MRINYSDEEDRPGQFALWDANCRRSIRGKLGQRELRELEKALLEMPHKRLISGALCDDDDVCAVGAYARHKGLDLSGFDPEDETDEVGVAAGMPRLIAWKLVALNDLTLDVVWEVAEGPRNRYEATYKGGIPYIRDVTPEERYAKVLAWVREQLRAPGAPRKVDAVDPHAGSTTS